MTTDDRLAQIRERLANMFTPAAPTDVADLLVAIDAIRALCEEQDARGSQWVIAHIRDAIDGALGGAT